MNTEDVKPLVNAGITLSPTNTRMSRSTEAVVDILLRPTPSPRQKRERARLYIFGLTQQGVEYLLPPLHIGITG